MADSPRRARGDAAPRLVSGIGLAMGAVVTVAITFLLRYLTVQFTDDHFVHLSRAQQILLGDVPVVDFFDPGLILQYYASAAALALSGRTLFGEAVLTVGFVAAAAAVTFVLATHLSRSFVIGAASVVLVVASFPRLYNYPKVFFYVLALYLAWRYALRPGAWRLALLAITTAAAFLFRHDHGVYVGLSVVASMALLYWDRIGEGLRAVGRYLGITTALLLPFLLFIQLATGLPAYIRGSLPQIQTSTQLRFNRLPFRFDGPLVTVDAPREPRIHVRWAAGLDDAGRRRQEERYGLTSPEPLGGSTWSYVPIDERPENIQALVGDPGVEDTHNVDRTTYRFTFRESFRERLNRRLPLLRVRRVLPGVLTGQNALAWFYYVTFALPFLSVLVFGAALWTGRLTRLELTVVGAAALLAFVTTQALVRASPDTRLADVAGPMAVLGAWLTGRWLGTGPTGRASLPGSRRTVATVVWLVTVWSAVTGAEMVPARAVSILLDGPGRTREVIHAVTRELGRRPSDAVDRDGTGMQALTRYVFECTAPTDRLFVTFFKPEIFFYAERGFAGGQVYLHPGWHAAPADQRLTVERLERQRVPIVLSLPHVDGAPAGEDDPAIVFPLRFPVVYEYIQRRYTVAAESAFGGPQVYRVLVDSRLTRTGTYRPLGLPCYR